MSAAPAHVPHEPDGCPVCEVEGALAKVHRGAGEHFRMHLLDFLREYGDGYINVRVEITAGFPARVYVQGRKFEMRSAKRA